MSRLVLIEMYESGGKTYGRVSDPLEFMKSQNFAHGHIERVARALLTANSPAAQVEGFGGTLTSGLSMGVAAGQAITAGGLAYDTLPDDASTVVTMPAAHVSLPRIDLVYARLETVDTELAYRPHIELVEYGDPLPPEENFNVPTERHVRATVLVKQGTAAAVPVAPVAAANEVPLYQVRVNAGAVNLIAGNVTDVRNKTRSLYDALALVDALYANPIIADFVEKAQDALASFFNAQTAALHFTVNDPSNRVDVVIDAATALVAGLMSAADKGKLDGVAAGAQVNVLESVSGTAPIQVAAVAGKNQAVSISAATNVVAGSMSAADKAKLDASTSAATANALAQRDAGGDILFRNVQLTGKVPTYNNIATAGLGLAAILFDYIGAELTANLADVTMYAAPAAGAYMVCLSGNATGNGGDTISLTVEFTAYEGYTKTKTVQFTTANQQHNSGVFYLYVAASTAIKFRTTGSTGSGGYRVHATLIRLS